MEHPEFAIEYYESARTSDGARFTRLSERTVVCRFCKASCKGIDAMIYANKVNNTSGLTCPSCGRDWFKFNT